MPTIGLSIWRQFQPTLSPAIDRTTFPRRVRHPGVVQSFQTKLGEGLYENSRSNICHYVDSTGLIRGVTFIKTERMRTTDPLRLPVATGNSQAESNQRRTGVSAIAVPLRVNFARSSHAIEQLALSHVRANSHERACEVLLVGIRHDIARLQRRIARPSFRLYDLLALIALRRNQAGYLQELRDIIAAQPQEFQAMFAPRLVHWQNPSKRATNPERKWAGLLI